MALRWIITYSSASIVGPQIGYLYFGANGRARAFSQSFEEVRSPCVESIIARIGSHIATSQTGQKVRRRGKWKKYEWVVRRGQFIVSVGTVLAAD